MKDAKSQSEGASRNSRAKFLMKELGAEGPTQKPFGKAAPITLDMGEASREQGFLLNGGR